MFVHCNEQTIQIIKKKECDFKHISVMAPYIYNICKYQIAQCVY